MTLSEAALLAGLMKSPTKLAPNRNLAGANERAAQVITAMAEQGHITEAMAKLALANPAQVKRDKSAGSINYAADYVMDALDDTVGAIDEDIVVTTTIDLKMQAEAERALTDELNREGRASSAWSRARWSRSIPRARSRRWSADAIMPTASSTARSRPSASPARRSSPSSIWRRWRRGSPPTPCARTRRSRSKGGARRTTRANISAR